MATVSDVTIKYATQGAKAAQKADQGVRDSIKETAKTAREESGTISRWMQRHRNALIGIGAASAAAMMAIAQNSPALQAELATVRLGFSLLAMQIGNDLAPAFQWAGDLALDAAEAYRGLPDPVRKVTSALIGLTLFIGTLAGALAGLQTLISGTFVASLGSKAVSAIAGFISGSLALAAAVGAIIGLFVVWVLHITGILDWIGGLGAGLRNLIGGPIADFIIALLTITGIIPVLAILGAAIIGFVENGISGAVARTEQMLGILWQSIVNTFNNIAGWLSGTGVALFNAAIGLLIDAIKWPFEQLYNWLIGGSMIPDMLNDISNYIRNTGASLLSGAMDAAMDAVTGVIDALNPMRWGSDLMNELGDGIQSAAASVEETASGIAEDISEHIGFDNVQNDRMARRWGSDLVQEFQRGMRGEQTSLRRSARGAQSQLGQPMTANPAGAGGGGGGSPTVLVEFQRGAIRQRGDGGVEVDQRNVTKEQGSAFDSRSNI